VLSRIVFVHARERASERASARAQREWQSVKVKSNSKRERQL
jgi:hypothetical protein